MVLRDGQTIGTHRTADITVDQLIKEMVNRSSESLDIKKNHKEFGEDILKVEGLSCEKMGYVNNGFSIFL